MDRILFWRTTDKFGLFSNFAHYPIIIDGRKWFTREAYYQAMKHNDFSKQEKIRLAATPKLAKKLAYDLGLPRPDWESIKFDIMLQAIRVTCKQYPQVKQILLSTGDAELAEDSPFDYIWGLGKEGTGQNWLGKAWMQIRQELRSNEASEA